MEGAELAECLYFINIPGFQHGGVDENQTRSLKYVLYLPPPPLLACGKIYILYAGRVVFLSPSGGGGSVGVGILWGTENELILKIPGGNVSGWIFWL